MMPTLVAVLGFFSIHNHPNFVVAFGSAAGGFLGALIFFFVRLAAEIVKNRPRLVRRYLCVTPLNYGQAPETKGEFQHHRGRRVTKNDIPESIRIKFPIWEWSRGPTLAGNGQCLFFGPYAMDATVPGTYTATFRICGFGFTKPTEIHENKILLRVDVLRKLEDFTVITGANGVATMVPFSRYDSLASRYIQVADLARSGWKDYLLTFQSDGRGELEYRCFAYDGTSAEYPDTLALFGQARIFFESVTTHRVRSIELPSI